MKPTRLLLYCCILLLGMPFVYGQEVQPLQVQEQPDSLRQTLPLLPPPASLLHSPSSLLLPEMRYPTAVMPTLDLVDNRALGSLQQEYKQSLWSDKWSLQGAVYEGLGGRDLTYNSMVHALEKHLTLSYQINRFLAFQVSGLMGYTSLPQALFADKRYEVSAGLNYRFSDKHWMSANVSAGRFITSNYFNPHFSSTHILSDNFRFDSYGGLSFNTLAFAPDAPLQRSLYLGGQLTFTASSGGLFLYARGNTNFTQQPFYGWSPYMQPWTRSFGGGIGYNLPGGIPVSVGVDYVHNPTTDRYEPVFSLNLLGILVYIIKAMAGIE